MTNEQLTQEVMKLAEHQAKCDAERENMLSVVEELKEDIKATKSLAEDVHIMAINMKNMQETLKETNEKVEELSQKDYNNYKDTKKTVKNSVISGVTGSLITIVIGIVAFLVKLYIDMKGGKM